MTSSKQKNLITMLIILFILVFLITIYFYSANRKIEENKVVSPDNSGANSEALPMNPNSMIEDSMGMIEPDFAMIDEDTESASPDTIVEDLNTVSIHNYQGRILAGTQAKLYDFVQSDYQAALKTDKLIVLYFYASWCPICKEEVQNSLYPFFTDLEDENVIGFRVNFNDSDTNKAEEELAREFGVAYQHTKVLVKNGERVLKSPAAWDIETYQTEINNYK